MAPEFVARTRGSNRPSALPTRWDKNVKNRSEGFTEGKIRGTIVVIERNVIGQMKGIAVFGASSSTLDACHYDAARGLGALIAKNDYRLVFGGGDTGVMGAAARGTHEAGGFVFGVIPEALNLPGIAYPECDELIVTRDLRDRMAVMAENSDAFVIATGGLGTLYELFEVLTLNQLRYVDKPVVLLNVNGYYDRLLDQFEVMYESRCAREKCRQMYFVAASAQEAIDHILAWQPKALSGWMTDVPEGQVK